MKPEVEVEWRERGELLLFAANATAVGVDETEEAVGRANFYHGVREVREAPPKGELCLCGEHMPACLMAAVGLLE